MKTFKSLRESLDRKPSGKKVYDQKMGKHKVLIHDEAAGYVVYIDGDRLDDYDDLSAAKKAAAEFVKMNEDTQLDESPLVAAAAAAAARKRALLAKKRKEEIDRLRQQKAAQAQKAST